MHGLTLPQKKGLLIFTLLSISLDVLASEAHNIK